jgi:hypothetical protein
MSAVAVQQKPFMKCSMCNIPVMPGSKVLVIVKASDGALILRWSCEHYPVNESDKSIVAILGAMECATLWFNTYIRLVHDCNGHKAMAS